MFHTHAKGQGQRSLGGSKVETDGRTEAIALPCMVASSVYQLRRVNV